MKTFIPSVLALTILVIGCQKSIPLDRTQAVNYSGAYHSTGYYYHPFVPRTIDMPKTLLSFSSASVISGIGDIPTSDSSWTVKLDVDPLTNAVNITKYSSNGPEGDILMFTGGIPTTNIYTPVYTAQWSRSSECNNTYDKTTGEYKLRYGYVGAGRLRVIEEILKRD